MRAWRGSYAHALSARTLKNAKKYIVASFPVDSNFVHRRRAGILLDGSMAFISGRKNGGELIRVVQQAGLLSSL